MATTRSFPVSGPISLLVRTGHGSVTVTAQDDLTEARVTMTAVGDSTTLLERTVVEMRGSTLAVVGPRQGGIFDLIGPRSRDRDALDIEVVVPTMTAVKISAFTADITIAGRVGSADLSAGSSEIRVQDVDGDLRLRFGSSIVDVERVTGRAVSRSGSGTAHFGEVGGALVCGFGSGDLTVDVARGLVRNRAGSGRTELHAVYGDVDIASGSGGMTIGLPAGTSARLDVTSGSGVETEMPVENVATSEHDPITVRVRSGSGKVKIVRAA